MEKDKPDLKIVEQNKPDNLTVKQRKFIEHIVKGKVKTHREAYALAYDVKLKADGSIPQWVDVEASKLLSSNPKIIQSLTRQLQRKEESNLASSYRIKNYVLDRLYRESRESDNDSARIRSLELLGRSVAMFSDVVEQKQERTVDEIEQEIAERLQIIKDHN